MVAHLKDNKVALEEVKLHVGRNLKFDPQAETFIGDKEADALLSAASTARASRCRPRRDGEWPASSCEAEPRPSGSGARLLTLAPS